MFILKMLYRTFSEFVCFPARRRYGGSICCERANIWTEGKSSKTTQILR